MLEPFFALGRLYRADLPRPVDVPNLLTYRDEATYRWYALLVAPVLGFHGGRVRFAGARRETVAGPRLSESLLIVRYPSHRHFVRMVLRPYYQLVCNPVRARGVARFEASFTHAEVDEGLADARFVAVIGRTGDDTAVTEALEAAGGRLVYRTSRVRSILDVPANRAADPRPLRFEALDFVAFDGVEDAGRAFESDEFGDATGGAPDVAVSLYERKRPREMLPFGR